MITHGWKTNFDSLQAESWTTYPGVQSSHTVTSITCFRPCLPLSPPPHCLSWGSFSLCPSLPLASPSPFTHTHTPGILKPFGLFHSCSFAFSELGKQLPYFLPFPLSLPTHPSFTVSVQMPSPHDGSPVLLHLQLLLQELTTRLKENLRDPLFSPAVFKLSC